MLGVNGKVLVVDGNVDFAENVVEVLAEFGYNADRVVDPREAVLIAADYDCVVSEHAMPHLDGVELIEELRRRGCRTPVVILGARADHTLRSRALAAGALLVLSKYGFEQWACSLLNALQRLRRPARDFIRKAPARRSQSGTMPAVRLRRAG